MSNQKIAVIGDNDSVTAFKSVGIEVYTPVNGEQTEELIEKLSRQDYAVIFITEDKAQQIADYVVKIKAKQFPILLVIPTSSGNTEFGRQLLRYNMEKAIGMDIEFNF